MLIVRMRENKTEQSRHYFSEINICRVIINIKLGTVYANTYSKYIIVLYTVSFNVTYPN